MKNFITICVMVLIATGTSYAQEKIIFHGEVSDTDGYPLEFANVVAVDTVKKIMSSFGVTNDRGQFRIALTKNQIYNIKVSFIGYLPFEKIYNAEASNSIPFSIVLTKNPKQLDNVEIVSEIPVQIQGDTITYTTDFFTQGNERKLADVLEDLPGFEVDDAGEVKVNGKKVDKLLVEGKEFFDGNTSMATKNLPANVVDKVQLLKDFTDVGPLRGLGTSDQTALNILLKEDKKNIVFGDIKVEGGAEDRYLAHLNSFYYSPKINLNVIGNMNNIGKKAFTLRDYFRYTGKFKDLNSSSGSTFRLSADDIGIPMADRNNAQSLENKLGAMNITYNPNNRWTVSGFAIGFGINNKFASFSERKYLLQPLADTELLTSTQNVKTTSGLFKGGVKFTPNENLYIDYNIYGRIADIETKDHRTSNFNIQSNNIGEVNQQIPTSFEHKLQIYWSQSPKNIFSVEASIQNQKQNPQYDLTKSVKPFESYIPTIGETPYDLVQTKKITTHKREGVANYYRIINKLNHINFSIGYTQQQQTLSSNIFQKLSDHSTQSFNEAALNNSVEYKLHDYYFGLLTRHKLGKLVISPSINLHQYQVNNQQMNRDHSINKVMLLPGMNATYSISGSHTIQLNYKMSTEFTDIQNIAEGINMYNYYSLFKGNQKLTNSLYHTANLSYVNFNMYSFLNIYGGINFSYRLNEVTNSIQFNQLEQLSAPTNVLRANSRVTAYANIEKRYNFAAIKLNGNVSRIVSNNYISDLISTNTNLVQDYHASISSGALKFLSLEAGYKLTLSDYKGRGTQQSFQNHAPFGRIELSFLKNFNFKLQYEYNHYVQPQQYFGYDLLDAELRYRKKGSAWEFLVEGMNILNTNAIRRNSFNENLISTNESFIQKRYFVIGVQVDF